MTDRTNESDEHERQPPRRGRRWLVALASFVVLLLIGYGFVCRYIENKLERTIAQKLDAELRIGRLYYLPPYGLRISGARLVRKSNVILNFGRTHLRLAESPFGEGPILIERFDVVSPVVRVIRTNEGFQGGPGFVKEEVKQEPQPRKKFSDFLRLRHFKIADGQLTFDDDTSKYGRELTWRDIDVDVTATQQGPALYALEAKFGNAPLVEASLAGTIDVDELLLKLDRAHLGVEVDPNQQESPLPGELQTMLKDYGVAGKLTADGKGSVPFRKLAESRYDGTVELAGGRVRVPRWKVDFNDAAIKLRLAATRSQAAPTTNPSLPGLNVQVESVHVASGGAALDLSGGTLAIDTASRTWSLRELAGSVGISQDAAVQAGAVREAIEKYKLAGAVDFTAAADGPLKPEADRRLDQSIRHEVVLRPRGVALQPTKFPHPLREVGGGGTIRIANGEIVAEKLAGLYGEDRWRLDAARVPIEDFREHIQVNEIAGAAEFHPPSLEYPRALRATVRALNPSGEFLVSGSVDITPKGEPGTRAKYDMMVSSDAGAFAVTKKLIPVTNIRGDAYLKRQGGPGTVEVRTFDGKTLGGTISGKANFVTSKPRSYEGTASLREIDLSQITSYYTISDKEKHKLVGRGFANVELDGALDKEIALDTLRGKGRLEVMDGEFFELPVLGTVSRTVAGDKRRDLGTAGEAAAHLTVAGRRIHVREGAVSAPILGVQGDGTIGFDGTLDLDLVAAPLADWRDKLKQTNIPIVSDVTGELAGAIQRTLNAATRGLLYEFRVSGNIKDPQIKTVPVPVLSEARAALFGHMLGRPKGKRLIDLLDRKPDEK